MDNTKTCVGAFLFRNGRVLLGLRSRNRSSYPGVWDAIGGHVKPSESLRDALIRELSEEIQVTPVDFVELAELPDLHPDTNGLVAHHIFLVTRWEGTGPAPQGDEHSEIRWFQVSDVIKLDLAHPGYVEILKRITITSENQLDDRTCGTNAHSSSRRRRCSAARRICLGPQRGSRVGVAVDTRCHGSRKQNVGAAGLAISVGRFRLITSVLIDNLRDIEHVVKA
jgi:8-oxo-dGTP diphosphatase